MQEIRLRITPQCAASDALLRAEAARQLGLEATDIASVRVRKHAIDSRQRRVMIDLTLEVYLTGESPQEDDFMDVVFPDVSTAKPVIVVGAGPCGLFAALRLIELGLRPIVIERGAEVMQRRRDLSLLHKTGVVDPESNYSFGEGGAGAFSDGKLYTRSKKRGSVERILRLFCRFGADPKILVDAHPHVGTDKLPKIIKQIREQILRSGGEVHFSTRMDALIIDGGVVRGVRTSTAGDLFGPVILATGHSARDVYRSLYASGVTLEAKPIAVGVRLEHPQQIIDQIRYHTPEGKGAYLPPAEYVYKAQVRERGVYSFCMCPGGFVVPASTAPGETVVNGMSPANRGSKWANSGMVVALGAEDIPQTGIQIDAPLTDPLALMLWCETFEQMSYQAAQQSLRAPAQRLTDFLGKRASTTLPSSSYSMGLTSSRLDEWMPSYISDRLASAFREFERTTPGFITEEAQLIGVESRTSAPVRIPRHHDGDMAYMHIHLKGLYPAGEGAGYAGGIVSAAVDGENVATALAAAFASGVLK